jgi:hypothetical protein
VFFVLPSSPRGDVIESKQPPAVRSIMSVDVAHNFGGLITPTEEGGGQKGPGVEGAPFSIGPPKCLLKPPPVRVPFYRRPKESDV